MHVEKYKGAGVAPVSNHNARVYESRGYRRENIDSSLSGENYRLGPDRGPAKEWVNARVAALGLKRRVPWRRATGRTTWSPAGSTGTSPGRGPTCTSTGSP